MADNEFDLIVIGAGPGGYVAAIRAAQLGFKVACVEKESALGGTCLRVGCIPSKAMLESSHLYEMTKKEFKAHGIGLEGVTLDLAKMLKRKDSVVSALTKGVAGLFKKNGIEHLLGAARLDGPQKVIVSGEEGETIYTAPRILIATGSVPATLPGIAFDDDRIGSSTTALSYAEVPEHLVVIGAGFIGLELGSVWARLGAKVTVLEYLDRIMPGMDAELASDAQKLLKKQGLEFHLGAKVTGAEVKGDSVTVTVDGMDPITCDRVLMSVGRRPNTVGLGLESAGIELDKRGFIPVDHATFATTTPGVYAIGDVIGGAMLAHKAEEEGIACVEAMATGVGHVNYDAIPGVAYTEPEVASVGKTEDALQAEGIAYRKGVYFFRGNGRARALNQVDGKVKVLADEKTDRILGVHILGPRAGDLIAEAVTAIEFGASAEDLARVCHAHPTLAEVVKEAALDAGGRVIHA